MARKPRPPTAAELVAIRARQRVRELEAASERPRPVTRTKPRTKPRKPRTPRAPTAAERVAARSRARVRGIRSEIERKTPDLQSVAAVEAFKTSDRYLKLLQEAREVPYRDDPELRPRNKGQTTLGSIFVPWQRMTPKEAKAARDFQKINTGGLDRPRTDAELRAFLRTGRKVKRGRGYQDVRRERSAKRAENLAPAVKVLDYSLRPTYAVAGGTSAALRGQSAGEVAKAAERGFTGKERKTFSTVLREQGVEGPAASVLGFGLDVATDPLTYVSFGTSSVARKAAAEAAAKAAKSAERAALKSQTTHRTALEAADKAQDAALRKGASAAEARKLRSRTYTRTAKAVAAERGRTAGLKAAERVLERASQRQQTTGAELRFAGRRVPGVTRATSGARYGLARAAAPITGSARNVTRRRAGRRLASSLHGNVRQVGVSAAEQAQVKALQRETRSEAGSVTRRVSARANALLGRLTEAERRQVIDAIEADDVARLRGQAPQIRTRTRGALTRPRELTERAVDARDPDRLYHVARRLQDDLKYLRRTGRRSGLLAGDIGRQARTPVEARATTAGQGVRSARKVRAALREARREQAAARIALREADSPATRRAAARRVEETQARVELLRGRLKGIGEQTTEAAARRGEGRRAREQRRLTEAGGYFPRVSAEQVKQGGVIEDIAEGLGPNVGVIRDQIGANAPNIGAARRRSHRGSRASQEQTPAGRARTERLTEDPIATLGAYGGSIARASAARNLNTRIIERFGERLPRSTQELEALTDAGKSIYLVRRGVLERLDPASPAALGLARGTTSPARAGGRLAVLSDDLVEAVRNRQPDLGSKSPELRVWDKIQAGFKRYALNTPGYLVRNLVGDTFNAWGDERFWRLARNFARGQKALASLGRYEKALQRFERQLPQSKRTVKLTRQQAAQIARALGVPPGHIGTTVPAQAVALLAERMGVIRNGRFLELMTEGRKLSQAKGTTRWDRSVRWVEDSTRIATFLGGLQRGLDPREAAGRAAKIHFDYGDLTGFERGVLRRAMPFYTFTSRNVPLQAERIVTRPGKTATVAKALEEGRREAGLAPDFREGQNEYEARQLGLPIKWGGKTYTISIGAPFTDLNDIVAATPFSGEGNLPEVATRRATELLSPFLKVLPEVVSNYSTFYRGAIETDNAIRTRAPRAVIELAKRTPGLAAKLGLVDDYEPSDGSGPTWGWPRKIDYVYRQMPGAVGFLLEGPVGGVQKGENARGMKPWQQVAAVLGPRIVEYERNEAELNQIYRQVDKLERGMAELRERSHPTRGGRVSADNPTPEYSRLLGQLSDVERRKSELEGESTLQPPTPGQARRLRTAEQRALSPATLRAAERRAERAAARAR